MFKTPEWLLKLFRLTKKEYFADFFITPPITLAYGIYSITHTFSVWWFPLFALGWAFWTFYEYALHRWGLHEILTDIHELHHKNQKDYIALHPAITLAIYATFFLVFGPVSSSFTVGFYVGYIVYTSLHTAFHYAQIPQGHPLYAMKWRHVAHHRFHDVSYGVTTGLWDRLFKTEGPRLT